MTTSATHEPEAGAGPAATGADQALANEVHRQRQRLAETFSHTALADQISPRTDAEACLVPFLVALNWSGEHRHIKEALPHFEQLDKVEPLRGVLARLNIETRRLPHGPAGVAEEMLPCIYANQSGGIWILIEREGPNRFLTYDGAARDFRFIEVKSGKGEVYVVSNSPNHENARAPTRSWLFGLIRRFRPTITSLLMVSLAINFLALVVPIFIMVVYDRVVPTRSTMTLAYLVIGISAAVLGEIAIRRLRSRALA